MLERKTLCSMQRLSKSLRVSSGLQSPAYWELYCFLLTVGDMYAKDDGKSSESVQ